MKLTGIEPATSGDCPGALPLSYSLTFDRRNTKPQSGPRQPGSQNPDTRPSEGCGLMIEFRREAQEVGRTR